MYSILSAEFETQLDEQLTWFCPPREWVIQNCYLEIFPDAKTDYWQRTHYGFRNDNGHFLYAEVAGDFVLTTKVRFFPKHQYDQAGLMVRLSSDFWLKTSIEFEPEEPNRLGAVVTRYGYSDWSTQDMAKSVNEYQLRIRREFDDYIVEYRQTDRDNWSQIRMAHLENANQAAVQCGLYACSPIAAGFKAQFDYLKIETLPESNLP
jgi:regulation of enolase protein 1 (concanavalin A-like superfamily)